MHGENNGNPYFLMDDLGGIYPLFSETSIIFWHLQIFQNPLFAQIHDNVHRSQWSQSQVKGSQLLRPRHCPQFPWFLPRNRHSLGMQKTGLILRSCLAGAKVFWRFLVLTNGRFRFFSEKKSSTFSQKKEKNNFSKEVKQIFFGFTPLNSPTKEQTTPRFCAAIFRLSSAPGLAVVSLIPWRPWHRGPTNCFLVALTKGLGQTPHGLESWRKHNKFRMGSPSPNTTAEIHDHLNFHRSFPYSQDW